MSCCIGAFHASYHTTRGSYAHRMGIVEGGRTAILGGAGPMGLGAIAYALCCDRRPGTLVVTDIDASRLERAERLLGGQAEDAGIKLHFLNTSGMRDPAAALRELAAGQGFDDVFVFTPIAEVVELASGILGQDGCLNFFSGPVDSGFSAKLNFYDVHYNSTHVMGTTGGNMDDLKESLRLCEEGALNPAVMVTHIGGLDAAAEATLNLPRLPGGKKLIYTQISMPLTAIDDFRCLGAEDSRFNHLADICEAAGGLWCPEAERYLLEHWARF